MKGRANPPYSQAKVKMRALKKFWKEHTWIQGEFLNGHYKTGHWVSNDKLTEEEE